MRSDLVRAEASWLRRALGAGPDPLRRRRDWWVAALSLVLLIAAVAAVPMGAVRGHAAYGSESRAAAVEATSRREVRAEVVTQPESLLTGHNRVQRSERWAVVRWRGTDDRSHTARTRVPNSAEVGDASPIWVADGRRVTPPRTDGQVLVAAIAAGMGFVAIVAVVCGLLIAGIRALSHWWGILSWEREWASVEPKWTRRG